ncbi:hypothetical protein CAOG_05652 [Capsaspora owczarzaki ATCC 30864]|uniref:Uncharacterized protein n=1 Tax=Capsaspora owczarzaki (strain ATCC 30864) TaxID=595528 RepID=A0A0D2WTW2_CAPO3|nr:hypothetical protein CAOG_05652 [Capsaspora owczarzaki ATCC 30864]KJE95173.1 hypothetical protein CAOG_005652 [Capsaspora owczarzaki ATCC 30864]|eukprot:XP_004346325.1 hypothetical protein CAOG_05652 [Capsaspora owczarzaki ATCC 30864]
MSVHGYPGAGGGGIGSTSFSAWSDHLRNAKSQYSHSRPTTTGANPRSGSNSRYQHDRPRAAVPSAGSAAAVAGLGRRVRACLNSSQLLLILILTPAIGLVVFQMLLRPPIERMMAPAITAHDQKLVRMADDKLALHFLKLSRLDAGHEHDDQLEVIHDPSAIAAAAADAAESNNKLKEGASGADIAAAAAPLSRRVVISPDLMLSSRGLSREMLLPNMPPAMLETLRPQKSPLRLTIVSSASVLYFDRLINLIGSVHFWEPDKLIAVYDLGLEQYQRNVLCCMRNVRLLTLNFEVLPPHVSNLANYAFKALIIRDALERFGAVLYQDAGQELRQPLHEIAGIIDQQGYFAVTQHTPLYDYVRDGMLERLGIVLATIPNNPTCAGGIVGFKSQDAIVTRKVLDPWVRCSLDEECINPKGSTLENSRFDQSVLSLLLFANKLSCSYDARFNADFSPSHRSRMDIHLFSRRWHCPKPYVPFLARTSGGVSSAPGGSGAGKPHQGHHHAERKQHHDHASELKHDEDTDTTGLGAALQDSDGLTNWLVRYRCETAECFSWYTEPEIPYTRRFHSLVRQTVVELQGEGQPHRIEPTEPTSSSEYIVLPILEFDAGRALENPRHKRTERTAEYCGSLALGLTEEVPFLVVVDAIMYATICILTLFILVVRRMALSSTKGTCSRRGLLRAFGVVFAGLAMACFLVVQYGASKQAATAAAL